ncbi:MAG: HEAT repeat domain-containing protein [Thermodesulfovibrionales bacterium]
MLALIADYMEGGFLENIIDMFKHDRSLYRMLPGLMSDERGRVRLGTVALVESLKEEHPEEIAAAVPSVAALLKSPDPTIRADAAYLLGVIGRREALAYLREAAGDENDLARQIIAEAMDEIGGGPEG